MSPRLRGQPMQSEQHLKVEMRGRDTLDGRNTKQGKGGRRKMNKVTVRLA